MDFVPRFSRKNIPNRELLDDLKRVAKENRLKKLSLSQYRKTGKFGKITFVRHFGGWTKALRKVGLKPGRIHSISHDELIENMKKVWKKLGRQPRFLEMRSPLSKYSVHPYVDTFGSWNRTLEMFALYLKDMNMYRQLFTARRKRRKRRRWTGFKTRYEVFKRDGFTCKLCGRSPATIHGLHLQLDHIIPVSQGGKNEMSNFQTLCRECNVGKGNKI